MDQYGTRWRRTAAVNIFSLVHAAPRSLTSWVAQIDLLQRGLITSRAFAYLYIPTGLNAASQREYIRYMYTKRWCRLTDNQDNTHTAAIHPSDVNFDVMPSDEVNLFVWGNVDPGVADLAAADFTYAFGGATWLAQTDFALTPL